MDPKRCIKWMYKLGFLLMVFVTLYFLLLLKPVWMPFLNVLLTALLPFFLGAFITYLLHPLVEKLYLAGLPRGLSIFLIYLLFFGGVGFSIYKGLPVIIEQLDELSENAPILVSQYQRWMFHLERQTASWPDGLQEQIQARIHAFETWLTNLLALFIGWLTKMLNFLLLFAIVPFVSFYLLKDFHDVKKMIWYLTPKKWRRKGLYFLKELDESLGGYIRGQLLVCALLGTIAAFLFWIIDMKYPVLLGIIIAITDIIPYFGPIIGAVPAVIIAAAMSGKMAVYVIIIIFVIQFLEGNVLSPYIVGKSLNMHPLFIMAALIIGGEMGGIMGLILAVPILAVMKVAMLQAKTHLWKPGNNIDK